MLDPKITAALAEIEQLEDVRSALSSKLKARRDEARKSKDRATAQALTDEITQLAQKNLHLVLAKRRLYRAVPLQSLVDELSVLSLQAKDLVRAVATTAEILKAAHKLLQILIKVGALTK